jgi:DNA modification methylase
MSLAAEFSAPGSIHYLFTDWPHLGEMHRVGEEVFGPLLDLVIWDKINANEGSFYYAQHELIFVYRNGLAPPLYNIERGKRRKIRSNVWRYAGVCIFRDGPCDEPPTDLILKPIALMADAIKDCTRRDDLIVDPFVRSGTTLLAAERVGRKAYGMDSDPLFIDAAIRRCQDCTTQNAILVATGQTFDQVAAHRASEKPRRTK